MSMWTWHWIIQTTWDHATASLSLKSIQILTQSDVVAHKKKQMDVFQLNAIPVKTQDSGLKSEHIRPALTLLSTVRFYFIKFFSKTFEVYNTISSKSVYLMSLSSQLTC